MRVPLIAAWEAVERPVIGMVHLRALPGAPRYAGSFAAVREAALSDARALVDGGVHGLLMENFGDVPFAPRRVPAITVAAMTALAVELRQECAVPLGINVLRNDGCAALAIAAAAGAEFIRVNVLCGARVADQGVLEGIAYELLRRRSEWSCAGVRVFADVDVKHSAALTGRSLPVEVLELIERGGADALIVSGAVTGDRVDLEELALVRGAAGDVPVFVGSGVSAETIGGLLPPADGFIVGTSLKWEGEVGNPVDPDRVRALLAALADTSRQ